MGEMPRHIAAYAGQNPCECAYRQEVPGKACRITQQCCAPGFIEPPSYWFDIGYAVARAVHLVS